jgi:hypothetical protein
VIESTLTPSRELQAASLRREERSPVTRVSTALTNHRPFLFLLSAAIALRVTVFLAYQPVLPLTQDAYMYLERSSTLSLSGSFHPFLYPLLLHLLTASGSLVWVAVTQHVAGIVMGTLLYVLLRRLDIHPFLAMTGAVPVLFDGYQLNIEHHVLSETFSQLFVVVGLVSLAWSTRPHMLVVAGAGCSIALSSLIRFPALSVIVAALAFGLLRRFGWARLGALILGFLLPLGAYAGWFRTSTGSTGITNRNGFFLYGRVVEFADCRAVEVPSELRVFCPRQTQGLRQKGLFTSGLPDDIRRDPGYNDEALEFSKRMILAAPGRYVSVVLSDFSSYFKASDPYTREPGTAKWVFGEINRQKRRPPLAGRDTELRVHVDPTLAEFLRGYQDTIWTYGPLLALMLLLGMTGGLLGLKGSVPRLGPVCWLFTLAALGLLLFPPVFGVYHIRYVLPAIPLAGPAAVLGLTVAMRKIGPLHIMKPTKAPS